MNDSNIHAHIEELVAEEHRLLDKASGGALSHDEQTRLQAVNVQLDRYFDLLRQRRARREFGQPESETAMRPADVVERYLQ
jgi:uncharacterized protein DUF2630